MRPFFFIQVWEKDRWSAFETDEGGPEKQFIYFIWTKSTTIQNWALVGLSMYEQ